MVAQFLGNYVDLSEVRQLIAAGRDGASALKILEAAKQLGLDGYGVALDLREFKSLPSGVILHWKFNHFVVFVKKRRDVYEVIDPSSGRRSITEQEMSRAFTGVAIILSSQSHSRSNKTKKHVKTHFLTLRRLGEIVIRHRALFMKGLWLSIILQGFVLLLPLITNKVIGRVIPRGESDIVHVFLIAITFLAVVHFIFLLVRNQLIAVLRAYVDLDLTMSFMSHLCRLPYGFFRDHGISDITYRLRSNAVARDAISSTMMSGAVDGLLASSYFIALLFVNRSYALIALFAIVIDTILFAAPLKKRRELSSAAVAAESKVQGFEIEIVTGIGAIKAMGNEPHAITIWRNLFLGYVLAVRRNNSLESVISAADLCLRTALPLFLITVGATEVLSGHMSLGEMLAVNSFVLSLLTPAANVIRISNQLQGLSVHLNRLEDVLKTPVEKAAGNTGDFVSLHGGISGRGVEFRYGASDNFAIHPFDIEIHPGDYVGIVGRSGSGKSTIAHLLVSLIPPTQGEIRYDGLPLDQLGLEALRSNVGVVFQDTILFNGTVFENITMGNSDYKLNDVITAAIRAGLHDDICKMPLQYQTPVLDSGGGFSGGQRQRIAIARALIRKPRILLLDEATSALDPHTEEIALANIRALDCTKIVVSHRLSSIITADNIFVVEEGRVVEVGNHAELIANQASYAKLFECSTGQSFVSSQE